MKSLELKNCETEFNLIRLHSRNGVSLLAKTRKDNTLVEYLVEENSNNESIDVVAIVKDEMDKWTKSIDSNVAEIFSKNQEKFINQAQNKLKLLYSEISEKMKNQQSTIN